MSKKSRKIKVKGSEITVLKSDREDFISITDIARHKKSEATGLVISHWLSTRYTIEFMGLWEKWKIFPYTYSDIMEFFSSIDNDRTGRELRCATHTIRPVCRCREPRTPLIGYATPINGVRADCDSQHDKENKKTFFLTPYIIWRHFARNQV